MEYRRQTLFFKYCFGPCKHPIELDEDSEEEEDFEDRPRPHSEFFLFELDSHTRIKLNRFTLELN